MKAQYVLSIRQPWAWLIAQGFKDLENRTWMTSFRGRFFVHASQGMTGKEYAACVSTVARIDARIVIPRLKELERGGIVGSAEVTGSVRESASPWFFGPCGFTLANQQPLRFQPMKAQLGFFRSPIAIETSFIENDVVFTEMPQTCPKFGCGGRIRRNASGRALSAELGFMECEKCFVSYGS